ncbi:MAG TPA: hypothetical protein PKW98_05420 [Candidatus Wallbacteria bacterium]|nr:hypothetical protein [Candidatus Wallbacteria bacterium]
MAKKLRIITLKRLYIVLLAAASILTLFRGGSMACSSTDYNYQVFFQTEKVASDGVNYNPISDCVKKFCDLTSNVYGVRGAGETLEIKLLMKPFIYFEPDLKFSDQIKASVAASIETEIIDQYKRWKIHVCDSRETEAVYKKAGFAPGSPAVLTPEAMKKLYAECGIYAVIDISFYSMTFTKNFQVNIKTPVSDRRDLARTDKYEARIRYKITKCENSDILWIDEVNGLSDDSFYYSLFEKGIIYNLKQICINESAI